MAIHPTGQCPSQSPASVPQISYFIFLPSTCKTSHPNKDEHTASSLVHVQRDICYPMSPTVATPWFGIAQSVQLLSYELDEWIRGSSSRRCMKLFSSPKCPGRISGPPCPYSMATEIPSRAMKCQRRDSRHLSPTSGELRFNSSYTCTSSSDMISWHA
jgi:hypothetical protein